MLNRQEGQEDSGFGCAHYVRPRRKNEKAGMASIKKQEPPMIPSGPCTLVLFYCKLDLLFFWVRMHSLVCKIELRCHVFGPLHGHSFGKNNYNVLHIHLASVFDGVSPIIVFCTDANATCEVCCAFHASGILFSSLVASP